MATEFHYKPKGFQLSDLTSVGIGIALIVVPIIYPFGIGFRRMVLLPYPISMYVLIAIGICLLIYQVMRLRKEAKLREVAKPIVVDGDKVSFFDVGAKGVENREFLLSQVSEVDYDAEDGILKVSTPAGRFKFDGDFFDSPESFAKFRSLFSK